MRSLPATVGSVLGLLATNRIAAEASRPVQASGGRRNVPSAWMTSLKRPPGRCRRQPVQATRNFPTEVQWLPLRLERGHQSWTYELSPPKFIVDRASESRLLIFAVGPPDSGFIIVSNRVHR